MFPIRSVIFPRCVEDAGVGTERARIDAEEGEPAGIGIGDGLEDEGGKRRRFLRQPGFLFSGAGFLSDDRTAIDGRGEELNDRIEQGCNADVDSGPTRRRRGRWPRATTPFRRPALRSSGLSSPPSRYLFISSSSVSAMSSIRTSRYFLTSVGHVGGNVDGLCRSLVAVENERLHGDQIHHAGKCAFRADGKERRSSPSCPGVCLMLSNALAKSARSRSIRLMKRRRGSLNSSAYSQTFSV